MKFQVRTLVPNFAIVTFKKSRKMIIFGINLPISENPWVHSLEKVEYTLCSKETCDHIIDDKLK